MARLRLHVVKPTVLNGETPSLNALDGIPLPQWFADATGGELQLTIREHTIDFNPDRCDAARLQDVAAMVLPANPPQPTEDVALIFASSWTRHDVQLYGLMFDFDGEEPALGTKMSSRGIPRQACAIFLDAFADTTEAEMIHTSIHELGHVFNLQHDGTQKSFMGNDTLARGFLSSDRHHLHAAAQWHWDYAPGGSNFAQYEFGKVPGSGARVSENLKLTATPERHSFLLGETIILNLELTAVGNKAVAVPDELDPGFETLRIWYENPLGERLVYRSRNVLCRPEATRVRLSPGSALENNPRISLGRAGPTMRRPGVYRVWAEFGGIKGHLSQIVRSEVETFEIRSPRSEGEVEISAALRLPGVAACIIDKDGRLRSRERRLLQALVRKYPKHPALQHVRYSLAHYHLRARRQSAAADLLEGIALPRGAAAQRARRIGTQLRRARRDRFVTE